MTRIKVRRKGQVTLAKDLRERYGIDEGTLVEEVATQDGILIRPVEGTMKRWKDLAEKVTKKWPPGTSAVDAVREDRQK